MHTCPRCDSKKGELMSKSPVEGAWEVYQCQTCFLHGDPVSRKALQIRRNTIRRLKLIRRKQKPYWFRLCRNERLDQRELYVRPPL